MISHEAKQHFNTIVGAEMFEMDRELESRQASSKVIAASRGLSSSGMVMSQQESHATASLKARGRVILGQLIRVLAVHDVKLDKETLDDAKTLLTDSVNVQAQLVRQRLTQGWGQLATTFAPAASQLRNQYDQEAPRLITRLVVELELVAKASMPKEPAVPNAPTMNFHGTVGIVQVGNGNQATASFHIDATIKSEISDVLKRCRDELSKVDDITQPQQGQLIDLIDETSQEIEKLEPNTLKVSSSLRTIGEWARVAGTLSDLYEQFKPLLSYFGIHLS